MSTYPPLPTSTDELHVIEWDAEDYPPQARFAWAPIFLVALLASAIFFVALNRLGVLR